MMHGELNKDILTRVIERILSERNSNLEVKVTVMTRDEAAAKKASNDKTA